MTDTLDWRTLDLTTDEGKQELNRIIAAKNEWTEIQEDDWWEDDYEGSSNIHGLTGRIAGFTSRCVIPSYCTDLNAAIQLEHDGFLLNLKHWTRADSKNEWLAQYYNNQKAYGIGHWHSSPATAICLAWLSVADREK